MPFEIKGPLPFEIKGPLPFEIKGPLPFEIWIFRCQPDRDDDVYFCSDDFDEPSSNVVLFE